MTFQKFLDTVAEIILILLHFFKVGCILSLGFFQLLQKQGQK